MTTNRGLSSAEVAQRVALGLSNGVPSRTGRSTGRIIASNLFTRINVILFVLFVVVLATGHVVQAAFGLLIVVNSSVGIIQELRAKRTLESLEVLSAVRPVVIRDGHAREIAPEDVVQDDVIQVGPGDHIVVDGKVIDSDYLEVNESLLTGEADPVPKSAHDNVLSGTFVSSGNGHYQATTVGRASYAATLSAEASQFSLVHSQLRTGIDKILRVISIALIPTAALSIWVNFSHGDHWREAVLRTTASVVPMVPEGLVLLTSTAFALGVIRLGKKRCLVQELPAIEGLARVDTIAIDKTGTLTDATLSLSRIIGLAGRDESQLREVLAQLAAADPSPNPSIQALQEATSLSSRWDIIERVPFTSSRKFSGVSFVDEGTWVLGAPDVLGSNQVRRQAEQVGATGQRVLLLGQSHILPTGDTIPSITPVALVVLQQSLRHDAAETLRYFADQAIDIKVISGDNAVSVGAVTRRLGLAPERVVDARDLPCDPAQLGEAVSAGQVFGRVTPEQKRAMMRALQQRGHTVAMTGDGVNDVLALKDADLGIAMGSGAPATRSVAQLVLLDNQFSVLPSVLAEGRRVIGNIERVAKLFLSKTIYSVCLALTMGVLGLPFPLKPLQITVVGWFTIGIPAFLLSLAPNSERAKDGFVKRTLAVGVPWGITVAAVTSITYVYLRGWGDVSDSTQKQASTAALAALIITASWILAVVSRPWVTWRVLLIAFGYAFYTAVFVWPLSARLLELDTSNTAMMYPGIVAGVIGAIIVEVVWWLVRRRSKT